MADIKVSQMGEVLVASDNDLLNLVSYDDQNQTYVSGKVKASTLKSYMVDDLKVSDLYDTTITTPVDDDGLVYDATAQKWENKQITTKEQWQKNGAYNLCPNEATTQSVGEVTFTVASDGTVTAVINATTTAARELTIVTRTSYLLPSATYRMVGAPNDSDCYMYCRTTSSTYNYDSGNGSTFTDGVVWVRIAIKSGTSAKTLTFKPMITTDLNATYADYVPYAMTNRELTEVKNYRYQTADADTNVTYLECNVLKQGRVVYITGSWQGNNTNAESILTLPSELRPSDTVRGTGGLYVPSHPTITSQLGVYNLATNGKITQAMDTRKGTMGNFVFIYNL